MPNMTKGNLAAKFTSVLFFVFLYCLGSPASASGLSLTFPESGAPSQTTYSGAYEFIAFNIGGNPHIDNYTYVLTHSTSQSDPYGDEIWLEGTSHTLYNLSPGYHSFGLERWSSEGNWLGPVSYRFEVTVLEGAPSPAPSGGYPETIVGNQPYNLSVNGKGDATLDVPLRLIPGVADFKPSLSIAYSSSDGISRSEQSRPQATLGYGWSVHGVSEIRRCVVGKFSGSSIQLNNNDSLCLDGSPLVLVDGNHFSAGAVYRTKIHSNLLIEAKAASGGAIWFRVSHPDGTVVNYGSSVNSRVRNGSSPYYQWLSSTAVSVDGNTIYYQYNEAESGTTRIEEISYSGAKVKFSYDDNRSDAQTVSIGNRSQTQKSLLYNITVSMKGLKVREYHFLNEMVSGKNLLKGIQQCGYDVTGTDRYCMKPIDFDWISSGVISSVGALLKGVNDSLGADHIISYGDVRSTGATSSFSENPFGGGTSYTSSSQALSGSGTLRYVVWELRRDNGSGGYIDTNYAYQGLGRKGTNNWGFVGFPSQRITDSLGKNTYIQYRMDYPYFGAVASERQYVSGSSSELISRTDYVYQNSSISVNASGVSAHNPSVSSIVSPVIADGVTLGGRRVSYSRIWNSAAHSTTNGGSFTASFLSKVTKSEKYYRNFSASSPASSVWGNYSSGDYGLSGEEKVVTSVKEFENRTSSSKWLIGFTKKATSTHTNLGYQATSNTTSYTRNTTYIPWENTVRTETEYDNPVNSFQVEQNYDYDSNGNLIHHFINGGAGRQITYSGYVEDRYPTIVSDEDTYSNNSFTLSKSGYDLRFGYAQEATDENGRDISVAFDALGRKKQSTDEFGVKTDFSYSRCNGGNYYCYGLYSSAAYMMTASTPGKPVVREIYDVNNRVIRTSKEGFDGALITRDTVYESDHGRTRKVSLPYFKRIYGSSDTPEWIVYDYDKRNRVKKVTKPDASRFDVSYAANSSTKVSVKTITETVLNGSGATSHTKVTKQEFNLLGHMTKTVQGSGSSDSVTTVYDYNAYNQIDTVKVYDDGVIGSETSYEYDVAGNIKRLTDSNSGVQRFIHHPDGRLFFHYQNNDSEVTEYQYDGYGRIKKKIDRYPGGSEDETIWAWGAPNAPAKLRSVTKDWSYRETYIYNSDALLEKTVYETDYGFSSIDPESSVDLSPQSDKPLIIKYDYFSNGDLKSKAYEQNWSNVYQDHYSYSGYEYKYHYGYNDYGYQDKISAEVTRFDGQSYVTRSAVETMPKTLIRSVSDANAFGKFNDITYGNNVRTTKQFDPETGSISGIDTSYGSTVYQNNHYDWYSDGSLDTKTAYGTSQESTVRKENYGYDKLERLVEVKTYSNSSLFKTQSYGYDDMGNLKSQTSSYSNDNQVTNYNYAGNGAGANAVTSYKVKGVNHSLSYNNTGSVTHYSISGGSDRFIKYNLAKQPTKVIVGSSINDSTPEVLEEFKYNANGKLSYKKTLWNSGATKNVESVYYFDDVELTSYSRNGSYNGSDIKIKVADDVLYVRNANTTGLGSHEYLHKDYQGSVEVVTYLDDVSNSSTLSTTNVQAFGAFGARESKNWKYDLQWGSSELNAILNDRPRKNLGYTGHIQMERSGFIHMQGRLYDPVLGRFLSPDPMVVDPRNSQNWNRYSYVLNNPTMYVDPTGHAQVSIPICDPAKEISQGGDCPKGGFTIDECRAQRNYVIRGGVCDFERPDVLVQAPHPRQEGDSRKAAAGVASLAGRATSMGGRMAVPAWASSPWGALVLVLTPTKMGDGSLAGAPPVESEPQQCRPICTLIDGTQVPVGAVSFRFDLVPPSSPHFPFEGSHVHLFRANQNPNNCQCFWREFDVVEPPAPVGAIPIQPFLN